MSPARIVLVGFMGSGKSTVGKALAACLGWAFHDLDHAVERRTGLSVAALFAQRGEPAFREEERLAAEELGRLEHVVVATGGGAWVQPQTRALLRSGALTVWLHCDFETVLRRVRPDGSRPLARNHERMRLLWREREAAYRLADLEFDTSRTPPGELAERIADAVRGGAGPTRQEGGAAR